MKTKAFIFIIYLFFALGPAYSQDDGSYFNNLRIETGFAFTGSGDLRLERS
jgi:hypothetical protein